MAIYLGLGTNLGERELNLIQARDLLMKNGILVVGQSEVRETAPLWGLDQPMYLNQVIEVQSELEPIELLRMCKTIEKEMGREDAKIPQIGNIAFGANLQKKDPKDAKSRIIDIDLLIYHDMKLASGDLILPHPGNQERDFIRAGLQDLGLKI